MNIAFMGRILAGAALLAVAVGVGACKSASAKKTSDGWEVNVEGDDAQLVQAKGFENALANAQENLVNAQNKTPPNPDHVADWNKIIGNLIEAKKNLDTKQGMEIEDGFEWVWDGGEEV